MEKREIEELMEQRGFRLWAILGGKDLQFLSKNNNPDLVINCIIYPDEKQFEFKYLVPYSIVQIVNPRCSPFTDGKHFLKMLEKFMKVVNKVIDESEE